MNGSDKRKENKKKTKEIAYGAVLTAVGVAVLAIGSIITTLDISLAAFVGIMILFITIEFGDKMALAVYFCISVLSFIILPLKSPAFVFAFFMGWYPIFKKHVEKIHYVLAWIVKLSAFNTSILMLYLVTVKIFSLQYDLVEITFLYFLIANAAFVMLDIVLNMFIPFYIFKIRKRLGFKEKIL